MQRRNSRPIFLFGLQRGGTTLVQSLLASHPDVCSWSGELQQVFLGRRRSRWDRIWRQAVYGYPVELLTSRGYFAVANLERRVDPPGIARWVIDHALYRSRFASPPQDVRIGVGRRAVARKRLLAKGVNGGVFLVEPLQGLYSDATFFLLVRNGLALAEGWSRRGRDAVRAGHVYATVGNEMLRLARAYRNCHLVRYEDLVAEPRRTTVSLFERAGLALDDLGNARILVSKYTDRRRGDQPSTVGDWFALDAVDEYVVGDRDSSQIASLSREARSGFLSVAMSVMEAFGYDESAAERGSE